MAEEFSGVKKVWHSMDAWRGYYTFDVPDIKDAKGTEVAKIDLSYIARGPEDNEKYLGMAKGFLKKFFNVRKKIVTGSNVFSMNVALLLKPKAPHTWGDLKDVALQFEDAYVDYYTSAFSIFSGEAYPIDFGGFAGALKEIESKAKSKLSEVI